MNTPNTETRSVVVTTPQAVSMQMDALGLKGKASTLTITDDATLADAIVFLGNVKKLAKDIEEDKKKILVPAKAVVEEINSRYRPMLDTLNEVDSEVRKKVGDFQIEQQRIAKEKADAERKEREEAALREAEEVERMKREQQEKIEADAKAKADELKAAGKEDEAAKVEEVAQQQVAATSAAADKIVAQRIDMTATKAPVTQPVRAGGFSGGLQKRWTWKLEDISKVPPEYLEVKAGAVRDAMNAMVREGKTPSLPGITFTQESSVSIR